MESPLKTLMQSIAIVALTLCTVSSLHAESIEQSSPPEQGPQEKPEKTEDVCSECDKKRPLMLQSHEPNLIGVRYDSNDVNYIEFKLSMKYPLGHNGRYEGKNSMFYGVPFFYFAFTGVWGQYIETRQSSPVIAKRYNPELWGRWWLGSKKDYIDFTFFGHESNGQSIDRYSIYNVKKIEIAAVGDDPEFARDYISRGWDYVGLTWKNGQLFGADNWTMYSKFKYFLNSGYLQTEIEDYNPWEEFGPECQNHDQSDWTAECHQRDEELTRDRFDGISFVIKNDIKYDHKWLSGNKFAVIYTTGYKDTFENNTVRAEFTTTFFNVPIMLWGQTGYNSDLIDYYESVESFGLALEL